MLRIFKRDTMYVRLYRNRIEVKNVNTGKSVSKSSSIGFSNDRLLIADYVTAEKLLRKAIIEVSSTTIIPPITRIVLQPVDEVIKGISPLEKRAYLDFLEKGGGRLVMVYEFQEKLTDQKVIKLMNEAVGGWLKYFNLP